MAILAPSRAARSAMASPMPRLAPVMKSVFPDRPTAHPPRLNCGECTRRDHCRPASPRPQRASRAGSRGLQLEVVPIGILDIKRAALALRAVTGSRLTHRNAPVGEPRDECRLLVGRDGHAEVLEVAP